MGVVGAILVAIWAKGLIVETGKVLLDREMDHPVVAEIREVVETGPEEGDTRITDLHVWRVGKGAYSCAISVLTHDATLTPARIRERMAIHEEIVHTTIEIQVCRGDVSRIFGKKLVRPFSGRGTSRRVLRAVRRIA